MKNILLKAITGLAVCCVILGVGAKEMTPTVAVLLFGGLAWIFPFSLINKGVW